MRLLRWLVYLVVVEVVVGHCFVAVVLTGSSQLVCFVVGVLLVLGRSGVGLVDSEEVVEKCLEPV